jgi:hypothetical protein
MRRRDEEYTFVTKEVRVQKLRGDNGSEFTPSVAPQASIAIAKAEMPDFAPIVQKNVIILPYELKRSLVW